MTSALNPPAAPTDDLGIVAEATRRGRDALDLASRHLDPSLVEVLRILGFDSDYVTARGSHLYDADGRAYLDFHTGEGFASLGHNHPDVRRVLEATLAADLVDGVQIHYSPLAGMLGEALSERLPPGLDATFFTSSGAEAVDTAMKFTRAATRRPRLLACESGFHGVTLGPLALVGDAFFQEGFGPMLPGCGRVPFGDLDRLEAELKSRDVAAFFVEPIQGREVTPAPPGYLRGAGELCRRYGTLLVIDEIQTGLGRTGSWFAFEHDEVVPDVTLVGKALSGGYMPVAAMVTRRQIYQDAVGRLERSYVHQSTFGRNRLSMAAGLATLRIIERDRLLERAATLGSVLHEGLAGLAERHPMIAEVRGRGLMVGIELTAPDTRLARLNRRLIHLASEGLFPQLVVIPLHREHGIITMASGKNDVIKLLPPLTLSETEAGRFLDAFDAVLTDCESSVSRSWGEVRSIATAQLKRRAQSPPGAATATGASARASDGAFSGPAPDLTRDDLCLVTGASGFIGAHVVERLLHEGRQVRAFVRPASDTRRLERLGTVQIVRGDLTDPDSLSPAVTGCRNVVHCGALVSDWASTAEIQAVNVDGTRHLLQAAAAAEVTRFVHLSSTDVYGHPGDPDLDETYVPHRFSNWYSRTKLLAEAAIRTSSASRALETVILRPGTVYGPRSVEVVGAIATAIRARTMLLIDGGRSVAGLLYVENLLDAIVRALDHPDAPGEAFNLTDGADVTWRAFADDLAAGLACPPPRLSLPYRVASPLGLSLEQGYRLLRRTIRLSTPPLLSRQAVDVMGRDQSFSTRKAESVLGWSPRIGYADGLRATLTWLERDATDASDTDSR